MEYKEKTFEELETEVDQLLNIESDNLDGESIRSPKIFNVLSRMYVQKGRKLYELTGQLNKLVLQRERYYGGKETAEYYKKNPLNEAILKSDISKYVDVDPLVVEMRRLVKECEVTVKFLEESKKELHQRRFDVKNAIDYRRMMLGA